jgi:hypothetical protein
MKMKFSAILCSVGSWKLADVAEMLTASIFVLIDAVSTYETSANFENTRRNIPCEIVRAQMIQFPRHYTQFTFQSHDHFDVINHATSWRKALNGVRPADNTIKLIL